MPNFTLEQVRELLLQYTDEVGQPFVPAVIESIHKQTAGQPVLVNRIAQILTEEMNIDHWVPIPNMFLEHRYFSDPISYTRERKERSSVSRKNNSSLSAAI